MASKHRFKIAIVGGGVAGLSLAVMLERFDIDYVILEAYPDVVPQTGASIGLMPNGLRILDQLGCYEPIKESLDQKLGNDIFHWSDATRLGVIEGMAEHIERR